MSLVVYCGSGWPGMVDRVRERLPTGWSLRAHDPKRALAEDLKDAAVALPSNTPFPKELIEALPALRLIQQPAAGHEGIDLVAARARGIPVCNAPGASGQAVAEAALFALLALARRLNEAQIDLRRARIGGIVGFELSGKTLGIVGRGASGARLARAAEGLGMAVLSLDSKSSGEAFLGLLEQSDAVSIHCPLTPRTIGLFDRSAFTHMREGALLVNCARGPIIGRDALLDALRSGRLGGVGLDTYWDEPWDPDDPLFSDPRVFALPHLGGSTREAFARVTEIIVGNVRRLDRGEPLLHRVA